MNIEITNLSSTAKLIKLNLLLDKYTKALGKNPSAYYLNSSQWMAVQSGIKKLNNSKAKTRKEPINYVPVHNGIPVRLACFDGTL